MADYTTGRERSSGMGLWVAGGIVILLIVIFGLFTMGSGGAVPGDPAYAPTAVDPVQTGPALGDPAAIDPTTPAPIVE